MRPRSHRTLACVVALIMAALVLAVPASAAPGAQVTAAAPADPNLLFGAYASGDPYAGNVNRVDALEAALGRRIDIVNWFQNWGGGEWISSVQPHLIKAVTDSGRTPLITWEPFDANNWGSNQPDYRLERIARGDFDAYITRWADGLRAIGKTVYLRPMHEMNGNWYSWGATVNGNSAQLFRDSWRRMHDIFTARGASNVRWVWAPMSIDVPNAPGNHIEDLYPGQQYVDVFGTSVYNWGSEFPHYGGWQSFSTIFSGIYERFKRLGPQPIWVTEVGTDYRGGDKAGWIRDMFTTAATMGQLKAIVWFDENKERDWRAAPSPDVAAAFALPRPPPPPPTPSPAPPLPSPAPSPPTPTAPPSCGPA